MTRQRLEVKVFPEPPVLQGIGLSGDMYVDDASGTYTGTANALLVNPISYIHLALRAAGYGNETSFATGSAFGSFATARVHMDRWAQIAGGASWNSVFENDDMVDVDEFTGAVRGGLPEIILPREGSGQWRAFTWIPRYGTGGADWWAAADIYSSTALDPNDVLLNGVIASMGTSDLEDVLNHPKIEYSLDKGSGKYLRTATLTPTGSDDGYGNPWPNWPSNAAGAVDICDWSTTEFGRHEFRGGSLRMPFIHDPIMAVAVGWYWLARFYRPAPRMQFSASPELLDIRPGHIFRWSNLLETNFGYPPPFWGTATSGSGEYAAWESIYWRVIHAEVETLGGTGAQMVITAEFYPQYIGTEVASGFGGGGEIGVIGEPLEEIPL